MKLSTPITSALRPEQNLGHGLELQAGVENISDVRVADKSDLYPYEERGRFVYANVKGRF